MKKLAIATVSTLAIFFCVNAQNLIPERVAHSIKSLGYAQMACLSAAFTIASAYDSVVGSYSRTRYSSFGLSVGMFVASRYMISRTCYHARRALGYKQFSDMCQNKKNWRYTKAALNIFSAVMYGSCIYEFKDIDRNSIWFWGMANCVLSIIIMAHQAYVDIS